jgi:bla regulator protein BlaR1
MPVYQLIVAKGGPKLKESSDLSQVQIAVGASAIRGKSARMSMFVGALESVPDVGRRVVIDKTGLSGAYDFSLKWTPLESASSTDTEGASLFTAIEEQLGLKLVPVKGPGQVLVIDHIEQPSEN